MTSSTIVSDNAAPVHTDAPDPVDEEREALAREDHERLRDAYIAAAVAPRKRSLPITTPFAGEVERARRRRNDLACADPDVDPDLFFPQHGTGDNPVDRERAERAKAICRTCPAVYECAVEAFRRNDFVGVMGASTGEERRAVRRQVQEARRRDTRRARRRRATTGTAA